MSNPKTSEDLGSVIFSLAVDFGRMLSGGLDGRTIEKSGPVPAPVSRSRSRGSGRGKKTVDIFGPSSSALSEWDARNLSLASRLRARTDLLGSTMYSMTWKVRRTPRGRMIPALRATAAGRSVSVCIGAGFEAVAELLGWNTARASDGTKGGPNQAGGALSADAALSGWPTAVERVADGAGSGRVPGAHGGVHRGEDGRGPRDGESERCGSVGGLADGPSQRHDGRRAGEEDGRPGEFERFRDAGGMARSEHGRREARESERRGASAVVSCGDAGGLGSPNRERLPQRGECDLQQEAGVETPRRVDAGGSGESGSVGGLGSPESLGRFGREDDADRGRRELASGLAGATRGFWAGADWVLTRPQRVGDPPGLRLIKPRPLVLADGHPGGVRRVRHPGFPLAQGQEARVQRLKLWGDAIVPEQAAEFVRVVRAAVKEGSSR